MTTTFQERVRVAVENRELRGAVDRATAQLGARRSMAFSSLEHADLVRDEARGVKMNVLRDLAKHLERFEDHLIANGARVHWAETGRDANRLIVDIGKRHGVKRILKAKSMASEETHLNDALERAGFEVIETDLGEYVVQLAGDRPSHIIAPIIHMTRQQVGRVLERKIDVPFSDDPQTLASYARLRLRREFLHGDMGITGANFGVVEEGAICLVTNEGNGRMVTTLPRVHVVIMGIEKLVPTLADLDLFLKILARSATGQKLTAYTTLIRGPRQPGDDCGPEELHVILLDNGRSAILAGETAEILGCIRCGACLNACPVFRSIGGHAYGDTYAGPVGAILTPGLKGLRDWTSLPAASTLCGACREVCPVRLDIPRMLLALRRESADVVSWPQTAGFSLTFREGSPSLQLRIGLKAFGWVASRPMVYRMAARAVRSWLRRRARDGWLKQMPGLASGWTSVRDLKAPASTTFQDQWRTRMNLKAARGRS